MTQISLGAKMGAIFFLLEKFKQGLDNHLLGLLSRGFKSLKSFPTVGLISYCLSVHLWPGSIGRKETNPASVYFESGIVLRIS